MLERLCAWIVWWGLSAALWLALVDRTELDELLAGAGVAAAAATFAVIVRERRQVLLRPRLRWLLAAWRPALGMFRDIPPLVEALVTRGILRRDERGKLGEVPFAAVGDDARDASYRVFTETLGTLAPNTIVVGVDRERGVLLAHQLVATRDLARSACPLPPEAR